MNILKRLPKPSSLATGVGAISLALLANIGQLKSNAALAWFPVDLTLVMAGVVVMAALWSRIKHGPTHKAVLIPAGLMVIFLIGLVNSPLERYAATKVLTLYTVTFACLVAPFYLLRTELQRKLFIYTIVAIGVIVAIVVFVWPEYSPCFVADRSRCSTAIQFPGTETIGTARMAAAGFVVAVLVAAASRGWVRLGLGVSAVVLLIATLLTGNRASLLAIVLALSAVFLTAPFFRRIRVRAIIAVAVGLVLVVIVQLFNGTNGERLFRLLTGAGDGSVSARSYFWEESLARVQLVPWGIGWGGFPDLFGDDTLGNLYPHNLFIEVLLEAGWVAALALLICLAWAAWGLWGSDNLALIVMVGLLLFTFVGALISGDINSNRLMWMTVAVGLMQARLRMPKFVTRWSPKSGAAS